MGRGHVEMGTREVRANLAEVINAAAVEGRVTHITSRGRRIAAVVPESMATEVASDNETS